MLQPGRFGDGLHAYQVSKRANVLRVRAEAVRWGERGARVNAISPGIIITPLARDELDGPNGAGYRRMLELSPAGRAGIPDEVGTVGELLMTERGRVHHRQRHPDRRRRHRLPLLRSARRSGTRTQDNGRNPVMRAEADGDADRSTVTRRQASYG